jgi:dihydroflavonol-4-reductase
MILVTGASGMTGSRVAYDLASDGQAVRALRRKDGDTSLFNYYCQSEGKPSGTVEWFEGDLLDLFSIQAALEGCDTVFHCAGLVSFQARDAKRLHDVNTKGTENLINACLSSEHIRYFMHVSSVATLSRNAESPCDEEAHWNPVEHHSDYAISKYGAEREVWRGIAEGMNACIVNPSVILGPGRTTDGSNAFFRKAQAGFRFYTEGIGGFVDLRDVSAAMIMLWKKGVTGERFLLNGFHLSYRKLLKRIAAQFNQPGPSIRIGAFAATLFWNFERLRSFFAGSRPLITRETAKSAQRILQYNNGKIKSIGFSFRDYDNTIDWASAYFKANTST